MIVKNLNLALAGLIKNGVGASRVFCPASHDWTTLFDFLCENYSAIAPKTWKARFIAGDVRNAEGCPYPLTTPYLSVINTTVYYFREVVQEKSLPYQETILFQDDSLVVADKPHFLPVIPSGQYVQETLLVRLKRKLNLPDLVPLHRIDRDTAGVVLFGVQPIQRGTYQNLFRDGRVSKQYQAIANYDARLAAVTKPYTISNRLQTASNFMQMQVVMGVNNAHTQLLAVEQLVDNLALARYTLAPLTGKRHQLRVHMLNLGVPILGDEIYPILMPQRDITQSNHAPLQLLAESIAFIDPITGLKRYFFSQRELKLTAE